MIDMVLEQLSTIVYAVIAGLLSVGGFLVESAGIDTLMAGQSALGAWEAVVGVLLLVAGVKLIREKVLVEFSDV
ncbi:hypothetical protein Hrd1104_11710 [Halorhabdus sp. CBA1104]|uniref:hypothetical protein n=1 Tax=unclassified Halorhabdus TaxID=2621901 RepID=UPI0012B33504|nr:MULTISPECIES: hypothetical protein [unclassified Halorhabdus]QGN07895.1 hypothetical protein Hrd1104_11710 [Halorhabdus sp. CBA1104]